MQAGCLNHLGGLGVERGGGCALVWLTTPSLISFLQRFFQLFLGPVITLNMKHPVYPISLLLYLSHFYPIQVLCTRH